MVSFKRSIFPSGWTLTAPGPVSTPDILRTDGGEAMPILDSVGRVNNEYCQFIRRELQGLRNKGSEI